MKGGVTTIRKKSLKALMEKAKKQPTLSLGCFIRNKTNFSFVAIAVFSDVLFCLIFMWLFQSVFPPHLGITLFNK